MTRFMATAAVAALAATGVSAGGQSKTATMVEPPVMAPAEMPAPAPRFNWTGAYAGAALGFGRMSVRDADSGSSAVAGLFGGYRFDMGDFVVGGEAFVAPTAFGSPELGDTRLRSGASILLSAGMPVTADARTLGYVAAGPSFLRTREEGGSSSTSTGATISLGIDHMLTDEIMLRGSINYTAINNVGDADFRTRTTGAAVGLGFKF